MHANNLPLANCSSRCASNLRPSCLFAIFFCTFLLAFFSSSVVSTPWAMDPTYMNWISNIAGLSLFRDKAFLQTFTFSLQIERHSWKREAFARLIGVRTDKSPQNPSLQQPSSSCQCQGRNAGCTTGGRVLHPPAQWHSSPMSECGQAHCLMSCRQHPVCGPCE